MLALLVLLMNFNSPSTTGSEGEAMTFSGANTLTFPMAPEGTYCDIWKDSHSGYKKTVWFDRPRAYSARMISKDMGWKEVEPPPTSMGRRFASVPRDYEDIEENVPMKKPDDLETDRGLYFVSLEANWIFTRMYHYRDA
jgi:hypothetical protein